MKTRWMFSGTVAAAMAVIATAADPPAMTVAEFERLHREVQSPDDEVWRSIPWKTSLLEAQAAAAREGKPIFIWAMDGHPLGCT